MSSRWLLSKLTNRQFLIVGAVIVGLWAGLTAVLLKITVHYLQEFLKPLAMENSWVYLVSPTIGILFTYVFVKFVLGGEMVKGTSHVLLAIARKSSHLPRKEVFSHIATSALTVGFGGSAGLESPIVQSGSAIGSVFSSFFSMSYRERTLLLACGAAAGIATAFNAPIAGVLFALEVLIVDISLSAFIPLLIAGAVGALCSKIILAEGIPLSFRLMQDFNYHNTLYYILLGLGCGLLSAFYLRAFLRTEVIFKRVFPNDISRLIGGGLFLGLLILVFPSLFGEGYTSITALASHDPQQIFRGSPLFFSISATEGGLVVAVFLIALVKVFAVSLTLNAGGNGGNFAPALLVGACFGFSFAGALNATGLTNLPTSNFCLVAMAGVLTGIFHAPLTAIFLIAEITGGYELIIPLMIVSAISTAVSKYLARHSLDEAKLFQMTESTFLGKDAQVLSQLKLDGFVERDFVVIRTGSKLRALIEAIGGSVRNVFPILDEGGRLLGIIALEDIRSVMFKTEEYDVIVVDQLMRKPIVTVSINEDMVQVMEKFDKTGVWNIPVLNDQNYIGFVSKSRVFSTYREMLRGD